MLKADIGNLIKKGKIGVIPTDTVYGIVGDAFNKKVVEKIYRIRQRDTKKPLIILISKISDLDDFGVYYKKDILSKIWPEKVSVILPVKGKDRINSLDFLHRGTKKLAFRIPKDKDLVSILEKTGPIVAPSANPEGLKPAEDIKQAEKYFGDDVDFYISGKTSKRSSTLIEFDEEDCVKIIREGAFSFNRLKDLGLVK